MWPAVWLQTKTHTNCEILNLKRCKESSSTERTRDKDLLEERPDGREELEEDSRIKARDVEGEEPLLELCEQKYFIKLGRCRRVAASILIQTHISSVHCWSPALFCLPVPFSFSILPFFFCSFSNSLTSWEASRLVRARTEKNVVAKKEKGN